MSRPVVGFLLVAIAVIGLYTNGKAVRKIAKDFIRETPAENADPRGVDDLRFTAARRSLPLRGKVGYVSWPDLASGGRSSTNLRQAQYSLAPLIVVPGTAYKPVIGNFPPSPVALDPVPEHPELRLVKDCSGVGIYTGK